MQIEAHVPEIPVVLLCNPAYPMKQWLQREAMILSVIKGRFILFIFIQGRIEKMGNLSKSKIKFYIWDNRLRSCTQFSPRGKCSPGAYSLH